MTLREIIDKIQVDAGVLGNEYWTDARLIEMANNAQKEIQAQFQMPLNEFLTTQLYTGVPLSTVISGTSVGTISMPSDFLEGSRPLWADVTYTGSSAGTYHAREIPLDEMGEYMNNSYMAGVTTEPIIARMQDTLLVHPGTNASALRLYYDRYPADMSGDSDNPDLPVEYHHLVVDFVVNKIKGGGNDS